MFTDAAIRDFVREIAAQYRPEKVVLFGSYASGHPTEDSDVDLLVIMPLKESPVDTSVEMRMKLRPRFPLDLLIRTPAKIRERVAMGDDFIKDILDHGKVLYETHHSGVDS